MSWLHKGRDPHGCTFTINGTAYRSWEDLRLLANGPVVISPPPLRSNYVTINGKNGKLDFTELLTGFPLYDNRTGTIQFIVDNTDPRSDDEFDKSTFAERYSKLMNMFHGKEAFVRFYDDDQYFYEGRFTVENWSMEEGKWSTIELGYDLAPYKLERGVYHLYITGHENNMTVTLQKNNPDGTSDMILDNKTMGTLELDPYLNLMPISPYNDITSEISNLNLQVVMRNENLNYNRTANLTASDHDSYIIDTFVMTPGEDPEDPKTTIKVTGSGSLHLWWQNGRL